MRWNLFILRVISIITAITFLWTNCVWAEGVSSLSTYKIAAQSQLADILAKARMVYTGTALHSTLVAEGINGLKTLYANQEKIRGMLRGVIGEIVDGLKTLIFRDGKGGIAYYTFSPEGYFYRFTNAKEVDDPFNCLIETFATMRTQKIEVPINGDTYYQEIIQTSPEIINLVDTCLKELYPEGEEEYFDILDENTLEVIGRKRRDLVHEEGDWHRTVHVIVTSKDGKELLIQFRKDGRKDLSVGGHLRAGEAISDGALREIEEELHIKPDRHRLAEIGSGYKKIGKKDFEGEEDYGENGIFYCKSKEIRNREISVLYVYKLNKDEEEKLREWVETKEVEGVEFQTMPSVAEELKADPSGYASTIKQYLKELNINGCGLRYSCPDILKIFSAKHNTMHRRVLNSDEENKLEMKIKDEREFQKILQRLRIVDKESPYIDYKSPAEFLLSVISNGNVYITSGLLGFLLDKDSALLKAILKYRDGGLGEKAYESQGEYLAEEVYLLYEEQRGELEEGVIGFIEAVAEEEFEAIEGTTKYDVLGKIAEEVRGKMGNNDSIALYRLLESDKKENENGRNMDGIESLPETIEDVAPGRYGDMVILPEDAEIYVIGDTHGDSESTRRIVGIYKERIKENKNTYLVFLGDYVNNGLDSIGNLKFVLELKKKYPGNVILLNGNHEFRETYMTVLKEFFKTHWGNVANNPFPGKSPGDQTHYGHIRLELIKRFGVAEGERVYKLFEEWGRSLPYICFSKKGIMMSHSIGLLKDDVPRLKSLADGKEGDEEDIKELGYEAWKRAQRTRHSAMVNSRNINKELPQKFEKLGVRVFVIGHTHYMSGDIDNGKLITVCSSDMYSPTAGHYMFQEMYIERISPKGSGRKKGRQVEAFPFYLVFSDKGIQDLSSCIQKLTDIHAIEKEYKIHRLITDYVFGRINNPENSHIIDLKKYRKLDRDTDKWLPDLVVDFITEVKTYIELSGDHEKTLSSVLGQLQGIVVDGRKWPEWLSEEDIYAAFYEILYLLFPAEIAEAKKKMEGLNKSALTKLKGIALNADLKTLIQDSMSAELLARPDSPVVLDDSSLLVERVDNLIKEGGELLFIASTNGAIVYDLLFLQEILRRGEGEVKVTLAVKEKRFGREVAREDVEGLLSLSEFKELNGHKEKGLFKVIDTGSKGCGTNLMDASDEFVEGLKGVDLIISKGHTNMLTMRLLNKDYFVIALAGVPDKEILRVRHFTGLPSKKEPQGIIAYMPGGMETASMLDRRAVMVQQLAHFVTAMQSEEFKEMVSRRNGDIAEVLGEIKEKMENQKAPFVMFVKPELLGTCDVGREALKEIGRRLKENPGSKLTDAVGDYIKEKGIEGVGAYTIAEINQALNVREMKDIPGINSEMSGRAVYRIPDKPNEEKIEEGTGKIQVVVSKVVLEPTNFDIGVVLANELVAEEDEEPLVSPVDIAGRDEYKGRQGVFFNFLYYITKKLVYVFNHREGRQYEIRDSFIGEYIDCLMTDNYTYPPLYNKGAVGVRKDGNLVFGRIRNEGGSVTIGGVEIEFTPYDKIQDGFSGAIVYTPMYEEEFIKWLEQVDKKSPELSEERPPKKEWYEHPRRVRIPGNEVKGRYQIVFINDRIIQIGQGETEMPQFGWVLSIPEEEFEKIKDMLEKTENVWVLKKDIKVKIEVNLPGEFQGCKTIMGGGTLLIEDNNKGDFYKAANDGDIKGIASILDKVMEVEGWTLISSKQTQETNVPPTDNRQPRQIIGLTDNDEFFVFSFAGRFKISGGATYPEALYIIAKELEKEGKKIKYAFLLDDGGSVTTGVVKNGQYMCLMPVASGPSNYAGEVRRINSIGTMVVKQPVKPERSPEESPAISLDTENLYAGTISPDGRFTDEDFSSLADRLTGIQEGLKEDIERAKTREGREILIKSWREWLVPWTSGIEEVVENPLEYEYWMENNPVIRKIIETAEGIRKGGAEAFVHVAVGGSIIPTKAIVNPVIPSTINQISAERRGGSPRVYYTGDSFSPELVSELLDALEDQGILFKTIFNIVSKSGTTAETIGTYLVIRARIKMRLEELKKRYDKKEITAGDLKRLGLTTGDITPEVLEDGAEYFRTGRFFIATTGFDNSSVLYSEFHHRGRKPEEIDKLKGEECYKGTDFDPFYAILPVPEGMGGRFSGFSAVGLLLLAVTANSNLGETPHSRVEDAFKGVRQALDRALNTPADSRGNVAFMAAAISHIAEYVKRKEIEVLYFFDPKLADVAKLLDELYSESLQEDDKGIDVRPLVGTADNHTVWNGIIAGPRNKVIRFVMPSNYNPALNPVIPVGSGIKGDVKVIEGLSLGDVQKQATLGTAEDATSPHRYDEGGNVIEKRPGVPNFTQTVSAKTVAGISDFVFTLMLETAVLGKLNGLQKEVKEDETVVDLTYLQHWVEGYKRAMRKRCHELKSKDSDIDLKSVNGIVAEPAIAYEDEDRRKEPDTGEFRDPRDSHIVRSIEEKQKEEHVYTARINENGVLIVEGDMPIGKEKVIRQCMNMVRDAMDRLERECGGLGIFAVTDQIEIVRNLRSSLYIHARAPLAVYVVEGGIRKIKVDETVFSSQSLVYEELKHEFLESIARLIPGSNPAISDVVSTLQNVKGFLEADVDEQNEFLTLLKENPLVDPDGEYLALLENLRGIKGLSEDVLITSIVRYVLKTKLYRDMHEQFGLPEELAASTMNLDLQLDDALAVFNEIAGAKQSVEILKKVKELEGLPIMVIKTFTGLRVQGLDKVSEDLARLIAAVTKQIDSVNKLSGKLAKAEGLEYIYADKDRLEELKDAMGKDKYEWVVKELERNNYKIVTDIAEVPEGASVIRLVDPGDIKDMPRDLRVRYYLPMPYTRSTLYMAAMVLWARGDLGKVPLVKGLIKELYTELDEDDLGLLITQPWQILPKIQRILINLDDLRKAVAIIERAA